MRSYACKPSQSKANSVLWEVPLGNVVAKRNVEFKMKVLGRMLEHLGTQMYKRRDTALAELVANAWDAGANEVTLTIPTTGYDPSTSEITISDNGVGMSEGQVESEYLVVGRNRRSDGSDRPVNRKVMGRKGIGKLAGFGIAHTIRVDTTRGGVTTSFTMKIADLKLGANDIQDVIIEGTVDDTVESVDGTTVRLTGLKQVTRPDVDALIQSLGRRFSRVVHGEMAIKVNGAMVAEPPIDFEQRVPEEEWLEAVVDGHTVRYFYGFSKTVLKASLLQGFTLYANGKTAQAPPFFFNVETTASGQHGTRYMYGAVEVDYLDAGIDDESDLISTDRQEMDWEVLEVQPLLKWGAELTRKALRDWVGRKEKTTEKSVLENEDLKRRIARLDGPSQKELMKAVRTLGRSGTDPDKLLELAGSLVAAFEYRHFHDVATKIEATNDPEELATLLEHLTEWKVLESRAILEVVRGRLQIIDKFHSMLVNDAPETAPQKGMENLHDLIADYPWLLNPRWQVLYEEKTITKQLREWGSKDIDKAYRQRYDFLALEGPNQLLVIEIKRSGHKVILDDLQRLQQYRERLRRGTDSVVAMVFVSGPDWATQRGDWENVASLELLEWGKAQERTKSFYKQYRAVLEADVEHRNFNEMGREVVRTRDVVADGTYRGSLRQQGLGPSTPNG